MDLLGPWPQDRTSKFISKNLGLFNPSGKGSTEKKRAIHNESIKNLDKLIAKRGVMEEDEDEVDEKD